MAPLPVRVPEKGKDLLWNEAKMNVDRSVWSAILLICLSLVMACAANKEQIKWRYVQEIMEEPGRDPAPVVLVERWNAREVVFNVGGDFANEYFFILDGDELISKPVYWTASRRAFQIKITARAGSPFREGKTYRLAVDEDNPETGGNRMVVDDQFRCLYLGNFTLTGDKLK
jgi:hypothetical protein